MFGPVFRFEAIRTARRGRFYAARVVGGLALFLYLWQELTAGWGEVMGHLPASRTAILAEGAFARFSGFLFGAVVLLVPALTAGALGEEVAKRRLPDLLASRLSTAEILLGKVVARWLHVVAGLLVGVPALVLLAMFGGVEPYTALLVFVQTLAVGLFLGGLTVLASVVVPRAGLAALLAIIFTLSWLAMPPVIMMQLGGRLLGAKTAWERMGEACLFHHPLFGQFALLNRAHSRLFNPRLGWALGPLGRLDRMIAWSAAIHAGLGLILLGLGVLVLKLRRDGRLAFAIRRGKAATAIDRPPVGDDPMLWKERYAPGGGGPSPRAVAALGAGLVVALIVSVYEPIKQVFWQDLATDRLTDGFRGSFLFVNLLALAVVAGAGALSIVGEKDRETWTSLRTTLLSGREIVRGKIVGALWGARWVLAGVVALWLGGLATGVLATVGVLATAAGLAVFSWFAAALGVAVSAGAKDASRALATTAGILLLTNVGYFIPLLAAWDRWTDYKSDPAWLLFGMTPYLQWAAFLAPGELRNPFNPGLWPPMAGPLILSRGPAAVPAFGIGLALHGAAAWALGRGTARRLDREAQATPSGSPIRGLPLATPSLSTPS